MSEPSRGIADRSRAAFEAGDPELLAPLLDPAVRWGGPEQTPETCHGREEVIAWYRGLRDQGVGATVAEVVERPGAVVIGFALARPETGPAAGLPAPVFQVFTITAGRVVDICGFPKREDAMTFAGRIGRDAGFH